MITADMHVILRAEQITLIVCDRNQYLDTFLSKENKETVYLFIY